jgi:hypothetical protein
MPKEWIPELSLASGGCLFGGMPHNLPTPNLTWQEKTYPLQQESFVQGKAAPMLVVPLSF